MLVRRVPSPKSHFTEATSFFCIHTVVVENVTDVHGVGERFDAIRYEPIAPSSDTDHCAYATICVPSYAFAIIG